MSIAVFVVLVVKEFCLGLFNTYCPAFVLLPPGLPHQYASGSNSNNLMLKTIENEVLLY
jgi:hypothetical protein